MKRTLIILIALFTSISATATTILVPSEQSTIQAGIDAAVEGDSVIVSDGTYDERITFDGKGIVVASEYVLDGDTNHIANTIIDGDTSIVPVVADTGSVVRFVNDEDSTAELKGFTVRNGIGTPYLHNDIDGLCGGGIFAVDASPSLTNCKLELCTAEYGAGVFVGQPSHNRTAYVDSCITDLSVSGSGEGLYVYRAHMYVTNSDLNIPGRPSIFNDRTTLALLNCRVSGGDIPTNRGTMIIENCSLHCAMLTFEDDFNTVSWTINDSYAQSIDIVSHDNFDNSIGNFTNCYVQGNLSVRAETIVTASNCEIGGDFEGPSGFSASVTAENCTVHGQLKISRAPFSATSCLVVGGADLWDGGLSATNCVFLAPIVCGADDKTVYLVNCILSLDGGYGVSVGSNVKRVYARCCDVYGNDVDWIQGTPYNGIDTLDVFFMDPAFCGYENMDYSLCDTSPCAPENNDCGVLIGAFDVGCECAGWGDTLRVGNSQYVSALYPATMCVPLYLDNHIEIDAGHIPLEHDWAFDPDSVSFVNTRLEYAELSRS